MKDLETMEYEAELSMSNCDHSIDEGLPEKLMQNECKLYSQYAGWNFCGYVWFEDKQFTCQVWQYNSPREEITADTLEEIMNLVSEEWGSEQLTPNKN